MTTELRVQILPACGQCLHSQGRSDGGYTGIYTPKISNRFVHVRDINTYFEIAMTS